MSDPANRPVGPELDKAGMKRRLHEPLRAAQEHVLATLKGLTDYQVRRPMTPSATSLLGVVKHLAGLTYTYLGETFGRSCPVSWPPGMDLNDEHAADTEGFESVWRNGDMWARPEESREQLVAFFRGACAHADATIAELDLEAVGSVPHWTEGNTTTLAEMVLYMLCETFQHAGQMDVVRELLDGAVSDSMTFRDDQEQAEYLAQVQAAADMHADSR